jgi:hypothetical protein
MPRARLMTKAQQNLQALDPALRTRAVEAIRYLESHPGEGQLVPPLQYEIDPELKPPVTQYWVKTGTGVTIYIYFEVEGGELKVFGIKSAFIM